MSYELVVSAAAHAQLEKLYDFNAEVASPATALQFTTAKRDAPRPWEQKLK